MSIYGGDCNSLGGSLYDVQKTVLPSDERRQIAAPQTSGTASGETGYQSSTVSAGSPSEALVQAAELVAGGPTALLTEVLPADPSKSKLPFGLVVLGGLTVLAIWANSIDQRRGA